MSKREKPSRKRDAVQSGIVRDANGCPSFELGTLNRRVGKLWQRQVSRWFNRKGNPSAVQAAKEAKPNG